MDILKSLKYIWKSTLTIFTFYIIYQLALSSILSQFGLKPHIQGQNVIELIGASLIWLAIIFAIMMAVVLGVGYLVFTGWTHREHIPRVLKVMIAFVLGVCVFLISAPLSMVISIPFLPIAISTIGMWILLRTISNHINPVSRKVTLDQAINIAKDLHKAIFGGDSIEIEEASLNEDNWVIKFSQIKDSEKVVAEYEIDADRGGVRKWRRL